MPLILRSSESFELYLKYEVSTTNREPMNTTFTPFSFRVSIMAWAGKKCPPVPPPETIILRSEFIGKMSIILFGPKCRRQGTIWDENGCNRRRKAPRI